MKRLMIGVSAGLSLLAVTAVAQDMPPRKAGLWVTTMDLGDKNMPSMETKMCIDSETDAAMMKMGMGDASQACSRKDMKRDGYKVTIDSECTFGSRKMTTHGVLTFTNDTAYHAEMKMHSEPPLRDGGGDHTTVMDSKWTGPCPSDMVPGDMTGPNGMKMNLKTIMERSK